MTGPKYRKLPVATIVTDERYQRELVPARVRRIVRNFDARQLGALEVSERDDGTIAIFDGQHRLEALKELGIETAPCFVHKLTAEDEAGLFVRLQMDRKAPSPVERFRAQVFSGDEQAVAVEDIAIEAGFVIWNRERAGQHNAIRAINALERIYKREGAETLRATLTTVADLWAGDERSTDGYLLEGVAEFLRGYANRYGSEERDRLREVAPTVILRRALGSMQGGGSYARHAIAAELRKIAGVRGRPSSSRPRLTVVKDAA